MVVEKACLASRGEGDGCAALPVQVVHLWLHSVPFWPARVDEVQAEVRDRPERVDVAADRAERVLRRGPDAGCVRGALVEGGAEGATFDCGVGERFGGSVRGDAGDGGRMSCLC